MQFWLVGFGLSLAKMASENFRYFSGKKPQIEIDSEKTELTSTLLTYIKEYGHTEIPKSERVDTLNLYLYHIVFLRNKFCTVKNRAQVLKGKNVKIYYLFYSRIILTSLIKCDDVAIYYTSFALA